MQSLKEFSVSFTPYDIYSDIKKSSVAIFLGEVFNFCAERRKPS